MITRKLEQKWKQTNQFAQKIQNLPNFTEYGFHHFVANECIVFSRRIKYFANLPQSLRGVPFPWQRPEQSSAGFSKSASTHQLERRLIQAVLAEFSSDNPASFQKEETQVRHTEFLPKQ